MILARSEITWLYYWITEHIALKHLTEKNPLVEFNQTTSGIGNTTTVKCKLCGEEKDITDTRIW